MITIISIIKGVSVWLTFDQLRVYSSDRTTIETTNEFICFFKYSEPNVILGELFRDNVNRNPLTFNSIEDAQNYAIIELEQRLP